jgi:hypothetical protein
MSACIVSVFSNSLDPDPDSLKNLDPDPDSASPDPDLDSVNLNPKHWFTETEGPMLVLAS